MEGQTYISYCMNHHYANAQCAINRSLQKKFCNIGPLCRSLRRPRVHPSWRSKFFRKACLKNCCFQKRDFAAAPSTSWWAAKAPPTCLGPSGWRCPAGSEAVVQTHSMSYVCNSKCMWHNWYMTKQENLIHIAVIFNYAKTWSWRKWCGRVKRSSLSEAKR